MRNVAAPTVFATVGARWREQTIRNNGDTLAVATGAVAQLVERLDGIQEARGSNPLGSTSHNRPVTRPKSPRTFTDVAFDGGDILDHIGDARGDLHFVSCSFVGSMADDIDLTGSTFDRCDLTKAKFADSDLVRTVWTDCTGADVDFASADLTDARFERCELVNSTFAKAEVAGATWTHCKLLGSNFGERAGLGWTFVSTVLMYADLHGVELDGRTLTEVDLTEADLSRADFSRTIFENCRLSRANWTGARFEGADLRGADLGPLETLEQIAALRGAMLSERQAKAVVNALGISVIESASD